MKFAADFRRIAREALNGKWAIAVAVGLVAFILGGTSSGGPKINFNIDLGSSEALAYNFALPDSGFFASRLWMILSGFLLLILIIALALGIVYFILASFVGVGYAKFNLDLVDKKDTGFNTLFAYFSNWKTTAITSLLKTVYVLLWTLLFIIPGIVASYSYAMTNYILAETPELTASEALKKSKELMSGNRWRLFCLHFSFIGWDILAGITFTIGYLWLNPYKQAAVAAFYREISCSEIIAEVEEVTETTEETKE